MDIIIISGDAYVDHPAFGPPLIGRFLEGLGFKVGILAQPDWRSVDAFRVLGQPRLFFGVSAGNMDSMLNRLTAQKKNRAKDLYSPEGRCDARPDRATIVYSQMARHAYPDVPIVLGGIEASLRRIAHYDYWSDTVRRSILRDAKADLLIFGMGEHPVGEVAQRLNAGESIQRIRDVAGTAFFVNTGEADALAACPSETVSDRRVVLLPSFSEVKGRTDQFALASQMAHRETNPYNARPMLQRDHPHGPGVYFNPPALPLSTAEMDRVYDLPFNRLPHPMYANSPVPAFETVKHSLVIMRGCFGGCAFCAITEHEGRVVQNRSPENVIREVAVLRNQENFCGVISDVGGPTANLYNMRCKSQHIERTCRRLSCLYPQICKHLNTDHKPLVDLMRRIRQFPGIEHLFVASGVRTDVVVAGTHGSVYLDELTRYHVGGQLSVAPEHVSSPTLRLMRKPLVESFDRFVAQFRTTCETAGKEQYLVPYFISGHPGTTINQMIELAVYLKQKGYRPRQVQDFIPTPMSLATTMYHTGLDPITMKPCYVAKGLREKRLQKALALYWNPEQHDLVREALVTAGRPDLIGHGATCLVPPAASQRRISRKSKA